MKLLNSSILLIFCILTTGCLNRATNNPFCDFGPSDLKKNATYKKSFYQKNITVEDVFYKIKNEFASKDGFSLIDTQWLQFQRSNGNLYSNKTAKIWYDETAFFFINYQTQCYVEIKQSGNNVDGTVYGFNSGLGDGYEKRYWGHIIKAIERE